MKYDYLCSDCHFVFEIEKRMSDPAPTRCPKCGKEHVERYYNSENIPSLIWLNRPTWTYNDCKKYKTAKFQGKEIKVDPSKHGDLGAWYSSGDPAPKKKK